MLAGAIPADTAYDLWSLFKQAIRELNVEPPSRLAAATLLKRVYARQVVAGTVPPLTGAGNIVKLDWTIEPELDQGHYVGEAFGVSEIVGAYYAFDDIDANDQSALHEIEDRIRRACAAVCETPE